MIETLNSHFLINKVHCVRETRFLLLSCKTWGNQLNDLEHGANLLDSHMKRKTSICFQKAALQSLPASGWYAALTLKTTTWECLGRSGQVTTGAWWWSAVREQVHSTLVIWMSWMTATALSLNALELCRRQLRRPLFYLHSLTLLPNGSQFPSVWLCMWLVQMLGVPPNRFRTFC